LFFWQYLSKALPDSAHCQNGGHSPKLVHFLLQMPCRQTREAHDASFAHAVPVFFPSRVAFHVPVGPSCLEHESLHVSSLAAQQPFRQ
jgi:hypothetical protein